MDYSNQTEGLVAVRQVLVHGFITLLAVVIAFSAPLLAQYILYDWWPRVSADSKLLLATEIGLASMLVLLFNVVRVAWLDRHSVAMAKTTALVYVRESRGRWLSRLLERSATRTMNATRDACILTITGYSTLVDEASIVRHAFGSAYEIRVLLMNPAGEAMQRRVQALAGRLTHAAACAEVQASIEVLAGLRALGKNVTLRFYEDDPFWNVVVLGEYVWVRHCHHGCVLQEQPEYVFALQPDNPRRGLFVPFYTHFLARWNETRHPEYDFDTGDLVYRDASRTEVKRVPLQLRSQDAHEAA